jgi:segregation and condensation protein A
MEEMNLEVTSEFLIMASTLLYLKSKTLLPKDTIEEEELTEEELLQRIIDYKKYKEISKKLKEFYEMNSKRMFKLPDEVKLPKQQLEREYKKELIPEVYANVVSNNQVRINKNAKNIEKIAITDTYTVGSKVKDMYRELIRHKKFVFNRLFSVKKHNKNEIVTAFSGLLEMSRRSKILTEQEEIFGDITVVKKKNA